MSTRVIQTEEIKSQTGVILAAAENRFAISEVLTLDDLLPNELVTKSMAIGITPTGVNPVIVNYAAGQSLLQYAKFIPVPDGFTKNARLTYEDVVSDTIHNLIPLQTTQLVFVSGVFTGWNITLVGEDNGAFQTLYPSIVTVIPESIASGGGSSPTTEFIKTFANFAAITFPRTKGIIEVVSDETRESKRVYYMIPNTGAASGADLKYIAVTQTNEP